MAMIQQRQARLGRLSLRGLQAWMELGRAHVAAVACSPVAIRLFPGFAAKKIKREGCLFCAQDDVTVNRIVAENKTFFVREDNFPATRGHVEIVPKRHVVSFFDLTPREIRDAYELLKVARDKITQMWSAPDGYTIGVNEGEAAGRSVDHLHIHLIPRRIGDVDDPRGGIRRVVPNCDPDLWARETDDWAARVGLSRVAEFAEH